MILGAKRVDSLTWRIKRGLWYLLASLNAFSKTTFPVGERSVATSRGNLDESILGSLDHDGEYGLRLY
jgi:hypothetical protein